MKLHTDDEVKAYQALSKCKESSKAIAQLVKAGMDSATAKKIMADLERRIIRDNRKEAVPKMIQGFGIMLVSYIAMQFVAGIVLLILLFPMAIGAVKVFQGFLQYVSPSPSYLEDA